MAMALANDHLFLFFAGSAAFSGLFLLIAAATGALHSHGGHLWHLGRGGGGGRGPQLGRASGGGHGAHTSHGPHGSAGGNGAGAHHGLHSGKAGPHLHTGKAHLHLEAGKQSHNIHTDHLGHDLQTGKAGHGAHGDAQGHEAGQRGDDAHVVHPGHPGAGMVMPQRRAPWSGFTSLLVSSLNVYGLLSFLFHMGVAGMVIRSGSKLLPIPVLLLSALIGVVAALAWSAALARLFGDRSGLVTKENSQIEGREVTVTRAIRRGGTGEVLFTPQGRVFQNIPARSMDGQPIPAGEMAVVVAVREGIALVERLDLLSGPDAGADAGNCEDNESPS